MPTVDVAEQALGDLGIGDVLTALDKCPAMVAITVGPEHRLVFQNSASASLTGLRRLGVPFAEAFPEASSSDLCALDRVLGDGEVYEERPPDVGLLGLGRAGLHLQYTYAPIVRRDGDELAVGVMMTAVDVTAGAIAQEAALRARLLVDIATRMNDSVDPDEALQRLCEALVPALADVAAVYVMPNTESGLDSGRTARRWVSDAGTPAAVAMAVSAPVMAQYGAPPPSSSAADRVSYFDALRSGRTVLMDISRSDVGRAEDANGAWVRAVGGHTMVLLPFVVAGDLAGALVLFGAKGREPYTDDDLPFLEQAAARASAVVTHLRSYRDQREVAMELQRSLLPDVPNRLEGAKVAARYVAGGLKTPIGGDWWDVLCTPDKHIGLGIGDVAGRGVRAAVIMGQARAAMRAAALAALEPGDLLRLLDTQLCDVLQTDPDDESPSLPSFATAAYGIIDPVAHTLRVANAGHPPLVVRYPVGGTRLVQAPPGPPLGLGIADYRDVVVPFPPGSLAVAYTDGLVESRTRQVDHGVELLRSYVAGLDPALDLETAVDVLLELMNRRAGHDDDVALVLLRTDAEAAA